MKRALTVVAIVLIALAAGAAPGTAHEEISPSSVATGRSAFLTFTAANERQVALTSVTLAAPAGLVFGSVTREPEGWTLARGPAGLTWSGGAVAPGKFEQWGAELEPPDLPGSFTFRSTLRFADGRTDSHDVPLTVLSPSTPTSVAPAGVAATSTVAVPTTVAAGPSPPASVSTDASGDADAARRQANLALGVGAGGLVVGLVALVAGARRPRAGGPAQAPAAEQQW